MVGIYASYLGCCYQLRSLKINQSLIPSTGNVQDFYNNLTSTIFAIVAKTGVNTGGDVFPQIFGWR